MTISKEMKLRAYRRIDFREHGLLPMLLSGVKFPIDYRDLNMIIYKRINVFRVKIVKCKNNRWGNIFVKEATMDYKVFLDTVESLT